MSVILQSADALRFKAVEALSKKGLELTPTEAIRALRLATDIELEIFMGRGLKAARPLGGEDETDNKETLSEEEERADLYSRLARIAARQAQVKISGRTEPKGP